MKPFLTSGIGSMPRRPWLFENRTGLDGKPDHYGRGGKWSVPEDKLQSAQDDATRIAIRIQEKAGLDIISDDDKSWLNKSWHRLPPWSDSKEGLLRLKSKFIIGAQSNGNISLIVNMSKISKLYWDVILGSEVVGHYKPEPSAYKKACEKLDLKTEECLMVAAHNDDLKGARNEGMKTAFVLRSKEHGNKQVSDLKPSQDWDYIVNDLHELADKLGCSKEGSF